MKKMNILFCGLRITLAIELKLIEWLIELEKYGHSSLNL